MSLDDRHALFKSGTWLKRRVDRVEFLDLMTVRRTVVLTLDLGEFAHVLPPCRSSTIPLGWFVPWARRVRIRHLAPLSRACQSHRCFPPRPAACSSSGTLSAPAWSGRSTRVQQAAFLRSTITKVGSGSMGNSPKILIRSRRL